MKILITGALGHIGSFIIKDLVKIKKLKKIYLVDNLSNGRFNVLFKITNKKINFLLGDLTNNNFCKKIPKTNIVIHLASMTNAEKSFENKKIVVKNNLGCFKNILNYCRKNKSKLVHISSTSIYGSKNNLVTEETKPKPQSPYAEIKLDEENLLKRQNLVNYITLRFGTISGCSDGMRFHTAVNKFCFNSVMGLAIPVWGKALNLYRPYLSLIDASKIFKYIVLNNFFPNDVFNIFSENKTVREILTIIKKSKFKIKIKFINSKILNQNSYKICKKKIENIGINLNSKISTDIKKTLSMLKTN